MNTDLSQASAEDIFQQYNISFDGARQSERMALAKGLAQIHALYGDKAKFAQNVRFSFDARRGYSRYGGYSGGRHYISMNRCNSKGHSCASNNVAHLLHELGHRVGHASYKGGMSFYEAYDRYAGSCHPTRYSRKNIREQFAEVFAAFITYPEMLSNGSSGCRRAYAFFASDVFYRHGELSTCNASDRTRLASLFNNGGSAQTYVADARPIPKPKPERQVANKKSAPREFDPWLSEPRVAAVRDKGTRYLNQRVTWEPIPEAELAESTRPTIPSRAWEDYDNRVDATMDDDSFQMAYSEDLEE